MYNIKNPVLYIVFNRPDVTIRSFDVLRNVKPSKLYIAADGPRESVEGEKLLCDSVREIVGNVNWPCEVHTLFQNENLGCKNGVLAGINWFFYNESQGIILEDDVVPQEAFFEFCDSMLERYRNETSVFTISGFNQFGQNVTSNSYFFSRGFYPWGWATWKDRWMNYKHDGFNINEINSKNITNIYSRSAISGVKLNLKLISLGILDTWDYQMLYMMMLKGGYNIVPYANMTTNIGVNGAHSINNKNIFFNYGVMDSSEIMHPSRIQDDFNMNKMLWNEFDNALLVVRIKHVLLFLGFYSFLRRIYKKVYKWIN